MSNFTLVTIGALALGVMAFVYGGKKEPEPQPEPHKRMESRTNQSTAYGSSRSYDSNDRKSIPESRPFSSRAESIPLGWERYHTATGILHYHPRSGTSTNTRPTNENSSALIDKWNKRRSEEAIEASLRQRKLQEQERQEAAAALAAAHRLRVRRDEELQMKLKQQQQQQQRNNAVRCPISLLIHPDDFKGKAHPKCGLKTCSRACTIRCGRCLDAFYCCEEHQHEEWKNHATNCTSFISLIAQQLKFSVAKMHVELHPRRGSTIYPYEQWPLNVFAHFNCSSCSGSIAKSKKTLGNGKRPPMIRWASARTAIEISLNKMLIVRVYRQHCKRCNADAFPMITAEELYQRIGNILRWLRDLQNGDGKHCEDNFSPTDPHLPTLCEKCGYGANPHAH